MKCCRFEEALQGQLIQTAGSKQGQFQSHVRLLRSRSSQAWSTLKAGDFIASPAPIPVSDSQIHVWPQIKMLYQTWLYLNLLSDKMSAGLFYHTKIHL